MELITIGIVSTSLVLLVQFLKMRYELSRNQTQGLVIVLSVVIALIGFVLENMNLLKSFISLMTGATFIYEYIIKRLIA